MKPCPGKILPERSLFYSISNSFLWAVRVFGSDRPWWWRRSELRREGIGVGSERRMNGINIERKEEGGAVRSLTFRSRLK